jgi:ATP:ADP antiporter, AAA family
MSGMVATAVRRAVNVREDEVHGVVWSFFYHFSILAGYFVIRPIRDEMGVAGGIDNLPWLFLGTLIGTLLVHPLYTTAVSTMPRQKFVPLAYRFFMLNLVVFFLAMRMADPTTMVWLGRIFFIWTSVYNLFIVAVFWSFMADVYRSGQAKRVYGLLAVGGTIGAISGSSITAVLVGWFGPVNMLLVSALLLEVASQTSHRLTRHEPKIAAAGVEEELELGGDAAAIAATDTGRRGETIGGGALDGIRHVAKSPYLLGIAALMMFFTIVSTFLWFHRVDIVSRVFVDDPVGRTRLFANMEIAVQSLTLITQLFLTSRLLRWLGIGVSLAFLPIVSMIGFAILGSAPFLGVVVVFEVLRRAANFAIQRPAREVLYTVIPREDKFKAKHFNDTTVYRFGDQVGAWSYGGLSWLGLGLSGLAFTMVPISFLWLLLALWLGRQHRALHAKQQAEAAERVPA